jgi:hypothetical protein
MFFSKQAINGEERGAVAGSLRIRIHLA